MNEVIDMRHQHLTILLSNPCLIMLANQNLLVPDTVLHDALLCLSARDIGRCLATCKHLQRLVTDSSQLQLQIFIEKRGIILTAATRTTRSSRMLLDDAHRTEDSLRYIRFGSSPSKRSSLYPEGWQAPIPELVANAGDKIYMAGGWRIPESVVARHVLVYDLLKEGDEPKKVDFQKDFRFWAVDTAEGLMVLSCTEL
jgi:hypothetical protein